MQSRFPFFTATNKPIRYNNNNSSTPSRIESCAKLKDIIVCIEEIRAKVNELENEPNSKIAETIDYHKLTVMGAFLRGLDKIVGQFNAQNQQRELEDETPEVAELVNQIETLVSTLLKDPDNNATIQAKRNHKKEYTKKGLAFVLFGGAAFFSAASAFFWGAVNCLASAGVYEIIKKYTGLNNLDTASYQMVTKLQKALFETGLVKEIDPEPVLDVKFN